MAQTSEHPIFNIKAVSEKTGIPSVTLRAWERRHGYPRPHRSESGYRLYSQYDIAALSWLKMQTDGGLSIGQAIKMLLRLWESGENPVSSPIITTAAPGQASEPIEEIRKKLLSSFLKLNDREGGRVLRRAFSMHPVEMILLQVITPVMVEIGEMWHRGEISIATEHFATQQCRIYLMNALEALHEQGRRGEIVTACAPGEFHELGLLMLTIMLRLRGWGVTYLGPNTSLERLGETVAHLAPKMLLFSATSEQAAKNLEGLDAVLSELETPKPIIGLGGQAFIQHPVLMNRIPGTFLGSTADEAIQQVERILKNHDN